MGGVDARSQHVKHFAMNTHNVRRANSIREYELVDPHAILTDHMQDPPTGSRPIPQRSAAATCTAGWEGTPVLSVVSNDGTTETGSLMDDIVREGARRMLAAALEAEVNQYIAELVGERDEVGRRLVVRNGRHRERTVTTAAGPLAVKAPRVNDKRVDVETGERKRFSSKILAPWCRKSPKISEVLPLLYLHGLSSGDFVPAMEQFLGSSAGLSPATVTRLTKQWTDDHTAFQARDLSDSDYVYVWADGVHPQGPPRPGPLLRPGPHGRVPRRPQGTHRAGRGAA